MTREAPHEVRRFLSLLHRDGDIFEIRAPKVGKYRLTAAGYFDDLGNATDAALGLDGRANVYVTLNPVDPALLARSVNRMLERAEATTADVDITRRRRLFVDIDPVRPSGISSTHEELAVALALGERVRDYLAASGWPEPLVAMSGNGCYLVYGIDLANDPDSNLLVPAVLKTLAERFDDETAHVDTTVGNASRIIGVVGTTKRKGDTTANRPHRRSYLITAPDELALVTGEQLAALVASKAGTVIAATASGGRLDEMLRNAGIAYREQAPDANGVTWYHVEQCPFHDDGRPFECGVGQKVPDGAYAGHCFHPEGVGHGWHEFKRALGLGAVEMQRRQHDPAIVPDRPGREIIVSNRHRRDIVAEAWAALLEANHPVRFFRHGNSVVEIAIPDEGCAIIKHLGSTGLSGRLDRCADFTRLAKTGAALAARPPRDVVEDMEALEIPLPPLRGIIAAPVFSADGVLETATGYQPVTGLYYEPVGQPVHDVPSAPDATDLRAARMRLGDDLFGDFPWADEQASLANMIAALITPMVRELVRGPVPLFALDAPKAGNGKGLLATCIAIVTTGYDVAVMADTKNEEEFRKRVTTKLMEGAGVVLLDNVRRRLDSGALAALLTATVWTDRVLGLSRTVTLPVRSLFLVTGNNLQFSDEITRRAVSIRIDAKTDRPWEGRTYRHPDLIDWLKRHRHDVIWACLVLVQNWLARGRPDWTGAPMGSYESWCRVLGGILETAGISGFLQNRKELYRRGDVDSEEWRAFTSEWWDQHGATPVKVADLQPIAEETLSSWFDSLKEGSDDKTIRTKLGKALATRRDTRFEDLFIRQARGDGHSKTARWYVEPAPTSPLRAGVGAEKEVTPAAPPQQDALSADSFAGEAGIAGVNSDLGKRMQITEAEVDACAESSNPTPHYPPTPRSDSEVARVDAGDVKASVTDGGPYPQCKRCRRVPETPSSNLCDQCRAGALRRVMKGQV